QDAHALDHNRGGARFSRFAAPEHRFLERAFARANRDGRPRGRRLLPVVRHRGRGPMDRLCAQRLIDRDGRNQSERNRGPNVESVTTFLSSVEATRLAEFIRESEWAFPAIESTHVIALALVIGTISIVDLRLLGLASTNRAYSELATQVLPWTWGAFVLAVISGTLMFISQPQAYLGNLAFRV